jgi:hypothetical protein
MHRMPIARLAISPTNDGPVQIIASLGIAIAAVVIVVAADMGGGGEWDVGGGGIWVVCCVVWHKLPHMGRE